MTAAASAAVKLLQPATTGATNSNTNGSAAGSSASAATGTTAAAAPVALGGQRIMQINSVAGNYDAKSLKLLLYECVRLHVRAKTRAVGDG